jgi:hypothetical protein
LGRIGALREFNDPWLEPEDNDKGPGTRRLNVILMPLRTRPGPVPIKWIYTTSSNPVRSAEREGSGKTPLGGMVAISRFR